jgi:uncharacterized protein (TIGR00255 family)
MLRSMTGFGRGTGRAGDTEATVEIRAVNGRFCEVAVRGPRVLNAFDPAVQALCKERLERGSINVSVTLQRRTAEAALAVDRAAARAYGRLLLDLRDAAGLDVHQAPVTLDHLLRYDVLTSAEPDVEAEQTEAWTAVEPALMEALDRLDAMRVQEGRALREDLTARLDALEQHLAAVAERAPARVSEAQARLRDRLAELAGDDRLNPDRLETEIALLADRLDVTEEAVRLRSHLAQFRDALDAGEPVGRRLNFLAQELNREVNTIASKANDADLAALAVRMKEELEKVREQVQNVV